MNITILIPVKSLTKAKSRLAIYLSERERKELVLNMLRHVIETVKSSPYKLDIFVVTNDNHIKQFSKNLGVQVIFSQVEGMNRSLTDAVKKIAIPSPIAVISADLPLLNQQDLTALMTLFENNGIVLVSAKEKTGTNAIFMREIRIPFLFGENSLPRFLSAAKKSGIKASVYTSYTSAFDIDTISDYRILQTKVA